jgi:hypothetical protein
MSRPRATFSLALALIGQETATSRSSPRPHDPNGGVADSLDEATAAFRAA